MNTLLLCALPAVTAGTIRDHVQALARLSAHRMFCFRHVGVVSNRLPGGIDLERFDAIVFHYSLYLLSDSYIGARDRSMIASFRGVKVLFLQDEYRNIDRAHAVIRELGVDVLFTCVPEEEIEQVYPTSTLPGLIKINNLTGYVPDTLTRISVPPINERRVDVGYRARTVPFWLGRLGAEKWQIVPRFLSATRDARLACDLSNREEDRIYGEAWVRFVTSCKTTLGVESGASVFDFDGSIERDVDAYVAANPNATFEEVEDRFLHQHEGKIRLNQISPRSFEAAALRTVMVLFEGEYSGILKPWRHYVPLRKDFSNIAEVIAAIRNTTLLQEIADCTYAEIALNPKYSYKAFVARFDEVLESAHAAKGGPDAGSASRTRFIMATSPAAIFAILIRIWLMIPLQAREVLKPVTGPLISMLRRLYRALRH